MIDYDTLNNFLVNEYTDVISYVGFYKASGNAIFRDIAREEMVHAKHIENFLANAGKLEADLSVKEQAKAALAEV